MAGMWKQIIYGRIDRNVEADYMLGELTGCGSRLYMGELTGMWKKIICYGSRLYMGELTGMWKQIIYGRIDRNVEADYIWAN